MRKPLLAALTVTLTGLLSAVAQTSVPLTGPFPQNNTPPIPAPCLRPSLPRPSRRPATSPWPWASPPTSSRG